MGTLNFVYGIDMNMVLMQNGHEAIADNGNNMLGFK